MKQAMSTREYRKKLAALTPEAQIKHQNFMHLMGAAKNRDKDELTRLLKSFKKRGPS